MRKHRCVTLLILLLAGGPACATLGPRTIRGDRFNYNEAGAESSKEQILLNIVRLRYGEPIYMLEIGSMLSQFSIEAGGTLSAWENDLHGTYGPALRAAFGLRGDATRQQTAAANLHYSDRPTITYRPLQGEEFARRVMAPIPPTVVIYLSHSGWSIDRLLACCVQQINDLPNRPLHDTDSAIVPDTKPFYRLAALLKRFQDSGKSAFSIESEVGMPTTMLNVPATFPGLESELRETRELLGYPREGSLRLRITSNVGARRPDELVMQTRSVLAAMYALAQCCAVPAEHTQENEVAGPRSGANDEAAARWLRIASSRVPQLDPFVQVFYNGHWFYIAKSDWSSKRTFALLTYLFSLQASDATFSLPVVTVPAGK